MEAEKAALFAMETLNWEKNQGTKVLSAAVHWRQDSQDPRDAQNAETKEKDQTFQDLTVNCAFLDVFLFNYFLLLEPLQLTQKGTIYRCL